MKFIDRIRMKVLSKCGCSPLSANNMTNSHFSSGMVSSNQMDAAPSQTNRVPALMEASPAIRHLLYDNGIERGMWSRPSARGTPSEETFALALLTNGTFWKRLTQWGKLDGESPYYIILRHGHSFLIGACIAEREAIAAVDMDFDPVPVADAICEWLAA
ncbi:MAG TPA: hypothetical protein VKC60_05935 [Opitutaceae bacterium]|nr:hypothetical protein [Opitutaceae bacterium]